MRDFLMQCALTADQIHQISYFNSYSFNLFSRFSHTMRFYYGSNTTIFIIKLSYFNLKEQQK